MTARRGGGHPSTKTTIADLAPPPEHLATPAAPALPSGPALVYITTTGTLIPVDREAIPDRRERRLYRALVAQADELAGKADDADAEPNRIRAGFQPPADS